MAVPIPQVITPSKASGAQVIDGSFNFDGGANGSTSSHLTRTSSSGGNLKTWTWSGWLKRGKDTAGTSNQNPWAIRPDNNNQQWMRFESSGNTLRLYLEIGSVIKYDLTTTQTFREFGGGWYHIVYIFDSTQATESDRVQLYINGERVTSFSSATYPSQNQDGIFNTNNETYYIAQRGDGNNYFTGRLTNINFIDGQALDASYFGFTDPLTNTWKPKKYTGTFGTNGFYLPLDGNSPIGEDKSGNGNDFTPVNFGGSVALDNPQVSGARPILNTTQGGTQAGVGVFGSKQNVGYAVTVYNDGGGNKYYIDGVKQDTVTGLIRGATYTFDTSDSTVSSHPFRFSATSNGSHGGGSEYTNGVAAITGAATTITVPHDAPNTLYYYCTSHSGMGADITGITTNEKLADQYASHVTLALPLVGSASDTSASIACTMTNKAVTVSGAAADSSESNFYSGSFVFDGSNDQLSYPAGSDFDFGGGDFTIETWINMDSISAGQAILEYSGQSSSTSPDGQWYFSTSNGWHWYHSSSAYAVIAKAKVPTDKWIHLALVREGDVLTHYLNGVCEASSAYTRTDAGSSSRALIIGQQNSSSYFDGHLQDYRIYKGVAKYSGTTVGTQYFVPASTNPDILPDTPSGVSGGSKLTKITDGAVYFDGTGDYLSTASSSDFTLGTGDFTVECFITKDDNSHTGIWQISSTSGGLQETNYTQTLALGYQFNRWQLYAGGSQVDGASPPNNGSVRPRKWYHLSVVRNSGTTKLYVDGREEISTSDTYNYTGTYMAIGGYYSTSYLLNGNISNLRVIKGTALYTANFTPPAAPLTNVTNTKLLCCQSNSSANSAAVTPGTFSNSGTTYSSNLSGAIAGSPYDATQMFDGSLSTYTDHNAQNSTITWTQTLTGVTSLKVYIHGGNSTNTVTTVGGNGTQTDTISTDFGPGWHTISLNTTGSTINSIAFARGGSGNFLSIYAVEVNGTVLIDNFYGETVARAGDAAATNFNPFNTDINTVRGQETGYATLNPLNHIGNGTLSNGNLEVTGGSGTWHGFSTIGVSSGKWYAEIDCLSGGSASNIEIGIVDLVQLGTNTSQVFDAFSRGFGYRNDANKITNNSATSYGATYDGATYGDTIGMAVDLDNGTLAFYKNGVSQGTAFTGIPSGYTYHLATFVRTSSDKVAYNFGQKPFKFPPPDGFQPLNAANTRPVKVISRPDQYVGVTTYTGITQSPRTISLPITPDFIWVKNRDDTDGHYLFDTVRGDNANIRSDGNFNQSAVSGASHGVISTIDFKSFTVKDGSGSGSNVGSTGTEDYVAWFWKAGGNKNTFNVDDVGYASAAAAGLTGGDITPSGASVGTKQGFSIVKFTGPGSAGFQAVPHGLTKKPKFILCKDLTNSRNWGVFHEDVITADTKAFILNSDSAVFTSGTACWDVSAIDATTFTPYFRDDFGASYSADNIAYLWHDVPGLQKFGSYTGNGSADGPYVELGFSPSLIILRNASAGGNWFIYDATRNPNNPSKNYLRPNLNSIEYTISDGLDILSNGFKMRQNSASHNGSGNTIIYAAWAKAPSVDLYGGGANAR